MGGEKISVILRPDQIEWIRAILESQPKGMNGLADYRSLLSQRIQPAQGFEMPFGPANYPVQTNAQASPTDLLNKIADQLIAQKSARQPLLRSINVTNAGQTLDWSTIGMMTRVMIRNKGASSAWIAFDQNGPSVDNFTSDNSWELQAQEALSIELCAFSKIGCRCTGAGTATIHAMAFPANSGDFGGAVS